MDKTENLVGNYSHSVNLVERKNMIITGVKKIENFDSVGYLVIKGTDLELVKLDTMQGNVSIKGLVISYTYVDDHKTKDKENSIFNRLFK